MRSLHLTGLVLLPLGLALTLGSTAPDVPAAEPVAPTRLVTATEGNKVRYRVRELLVGMELPGDAVGETADVTGAIVIGDDGKVIPDGSRFVVKPGTLKSDADMRDNYIRRNTLQTETHQQIELQPKSFTGLQGKLPDAGNLSLQLVADLTIRGVTRPTTWQVTGKAENGTYSGTATTAFTFADFEITTPRVRRLLSVSDTIRLEYDFRLVTDPSSK